MKRASKTVSAFTLVEMLVAVAVLGILAFLGARAFQSRVITCRMDEVLANARSLQQATQMMALDSQQAGKGLQWTSIESNGEMAPVSLATYFDALLSGGYVTKSELRKMLSGPGKYPRADQFTADHIAFKIFQVENTSPSDQPLVVTANWQDRRLTDNPPYGRKRFVVFHKGGDGGLYKGGTDAASMKLFPQAGNGPPGSVYRYVTLK